MYTCTFNAQKMVHRHLGISVHTVLCKECFNELLLSTFSNSRSASLVISSQFRGFYQRDIPDNIFMENPIILNFSFMEVSII